jgi:hypothetical protein
MELFKDLNKKKSTEPGGCQKIIPFFSIIVVLVRTEKNMSKEQKSTGKSMESQWKVSGKSVESQWKVSGKPVGSQ